MFIEVKTRTSYAFGTPLEAIGYYKLKSLLKAAKFYKSLHVELPEALRIDAISLILNTNGTVKSIELVKNIAEEYT